MNLDMSFALLSWTAQIILRFCIPDSNALCLTGQKCDHTLVSTAQILSAEDVGHATVQMQCVMPETLGIAEDR